MSKRKTHEEYVEELKIKNPNVEVIGTYINANTKITHKCLIHDLEWDTTPSRVIQGVGCPNCHYERISLSKRKTEKQFISELSDVTKDIILIEPYIDGKRRLLFHCLKHDVKWKTYPDNILRGCGCYQCGKEKTAKKNFKDVDIYIKELSVKNNKIDLIGNYVNATTKAKHRCLNCNYEWMVAPSELLYGKGCPRCNRSKGENRIEKWFKENQINFLNQYKFEECVNERPLPFDFYLPEYNLCIEYDGEQHFRAVNFFGGEKGLQYRQQNDQIKTDFCQNNNINLLRINYTQDIETELNNYFFN